MEDIDRAIVNGLQGGFPVSDRPYAEVAAQLDLTEDELIRRLDALLENGTLTRFGPMYHAERLGGALFPEVAHNYAREHELSMWFVLATETPERIDEVIGVIERATGYKVYNMPKLEEFYVGLRFTV